MRWTLDNGWTPDHSPMLTLRDDKGHPHALVMEDHGDGGGYAAVIITRDMPARSGFRKSIAAVLWTEGWVTRHLFPNATFGAAPELRAVHRRERHAGQAHVDGRMDRHSR
jgi:hypothetical protein